MVSTICLSKYFCVNIAHAKKSPLRRAVRFLAIPQRRMFIHMSCHASPSSPYVCHGISVYNVSYVW